MFTYVDVKAETPSEWNSNRNTADGVLEDFTSVVLRLETTNHCNFSCTFCPHSSMTRGKGFIDQPLAFSVLEQASKLGIKTLDLRNLGEPILDKRLPVFAEHAKNLGFSQIYIHTNAYRLTPDLLSVWKKSGITKVLISISPKREFTITRPGTLVDKFFTGIELLLKNSLDLDVIQFDYIRTTLSSTEEEQELFDLLKRYNTDNKINVVNLHNWGQGKTDDYYLCHRLWSSITVLQDGKVALCCLDGDGEYVLGDLNAQSLQEIVNSDQYRTIRKNHANGKFLTKCSTCDFPSKKDALITARNS